MADAGRSDRVLHHLGNKYSMDCHVSREDTICMTDYDILRGWSIYTDHRAIASTIPQLHQIWYRHR